MKIARFTSELSVPIMFAETKGDRSTDSPKKKERANENWDGP